MDNAMITTSWDDGHPLDLRLGALLKSYDIPATFYLPITNSERETVNPDEIKEIARSFDIGGHTYSHTNLTRVSIAEAEREVIAGKERLEQIIGRQLLSFAYPYGSLNDQIIQVVKEAGFKGSRTVRSLTRTIKDAFKMGTTVHAADHRPPHYLIESIASRDPRFFRFILKNNLFNKGWDRIAVETLDFVVHNGGIWHLWGHSWEIDRNNDWDRLEKVCLRIEALSKKAQKANNSQLIKMWHEGG